MNYEAAIKKVDEMKNICEEGKEEVKEVIAALCDKEIKKEKELIYLKDIIKMLQGEVMGKGSKKDYDFWHSSLVEKDGHLFIKVYLEADKVRSLGYMVEEVE